jgi:adenylylsulfate kinase-like enzyme
MVIWVTGLSASGKTTLCEQFVKLYKIEYPNLVMLDGDIIRSLYNDDLGFTEKDRITQIERIQTLAQFCEKQSLFVIVAALYSNDKLLDKNRNIFNKYLEVYIKADIKKLQEREYKNLYSQAIKGKINNVVGVDIAWNEPKAPHITFDITINNPTPTEMTKQVYSYISKNLLYENN